MLQVLSWLSAAFPRGRTPPCMLRGRELLSPLPVCFSAGSRWDGGVLWSQRRHRKSFSPSLLWPLVGMKPGLESFPWRQPPPTGAVLILEGPCMQQTLPNTAGGAWLMLTFPL